ncbi:MAG: 3'-5' exonuclease [Treponema sp.]|nr:3'-5' exonuclease [Treponema sp.]
MLYKLPSLFDEGAVFTAIDTETTGLNKHNDRIIEIGAVKFDKNGIIDKFSSLINPKRPLTQICIKLCGIYDDMLSDAPTVAKVLPEFLCFISGSTLIAHNANFDINFINAECERIHFPQLTKPNIPALDTVKISRFCFPSFEKHNLQFLAHKFAINSGKAHRALDDAIVCKEIFLRCINDSLRHM